MDKFSAAKIQQAQRLKSSINKIRERMKDTPIPWTRINAKSKPRCVPKPQRNPIPRHWTSGRHLTPEQKKYILDNKLRIQGRCAEISREIKWAESYAYNDRAQALSIIAKEIESVISDNKKIFGYDRHKYFSEETILSYAEYAAHQLFTLAIDAGNIRYDEDLPGYVDEQDLPINEYDFKFTGYCREMAKSALLEEYATAYKVGFACDGYIARTISNFERLKQSVHVRTEFLNRATRCSANVDAKTTRGIHFADYLQVECKDSIISKLRGLPINLPTKMYGAVITALIANGTMRPISDGERGAIYRALCDIYDDGRNIGTRQGETKYIKNGHVSPLDIASANSLLQI